MDSTDKALVNSNVVFVEQNMLMQDVVQMMNDNNISSVLVTDLDDNVVGILTERDIVRKFTLLDMSDKLSRNVGTLMTRPVSFVSLKSLKKDITNLHLQHKIRHFPVLNGTEMKKSNVVGIVSITDLARQHLLSPSVKVEESEHLPKKKVVVGILTHQKSLTNTYISLFKGLGFASQEVSDVHKFLTSKTAEHQALIFDLDGYPDLQIHELIPVVVKSKSYLIVTTSNPSLVPIFKKYLSKERQEIAMKPLDVGYITWMLNRKWHISEED